MELSRRKLNKYFKDENVSESDETESKNILLKTIYLTDKFPNPILSALNRGSYTERKSRENSSNKSTLLPKIFKSPEENQK